MLPLIKSLPRYPLKAQREQDELMYETIMLLTPKTLGSDACLPLWPLEYML